jgi:hypothetical protein
MKSVAETISPKQRSAIERIKGSPYLQPVLFNKAVGLRWFASFKEAGFLSASDIPGPKQLKDGSVTIPNWPITNYMVATSPELLSPGNESYATEFINFIRAATLHARQNNFGNYRVWWQFSKIICNVPLKLLHASDLQILDYWLDDKYERGLVAKNLADNLIIKLLAVGDEHCKHLALGVMELLYKIKIAKGKSTLSDEKEAVLRFEGWYAKQITANIASKAGDVLGAPAVKLFQKKLEEILIELGNDAWSSIRRRAIENHAQNFRAEDADDILIEGLRDALLAYTTAKPQEANEYVAKLLAAPFDTLKRIAIYTVNQRYLELKHLVDLVITGKHFQSNLRHEMWDLLKSHYPVFSLVQKDSVKAEINSLIEEDDSGQKSEEGTAYKRLTWLAAIKDYDKDAALLYTQYTNLIGGEPEHPDFSSYVTSGYITAKSPIPEEELLSLEVSELIKKLNKYTDSERFGEPGIEGLAKALKAAIKTEPLRFHKKLKQFIELDLPYLHEIIEGYKELWTEKKQLPWDEVWENVLQFANDLVKQERFWSPENAVRRKAFVANRHWIVSSVSMLIEAGTETDEHAFSETYLFLAESILLHILDRQEREEFEPDSDALTVAINSPRGRCIEALINLSLRSCRLADKKYNEHMSAWASFQPIFDSELKADGYELVTLLARYIPQFLYMSKSWLIQNLSRIFDQKNYQKWLCAIQGYSYVNHVYDDIYRYLRESGDLRRALDDDNLKQHVDHKITENIAVAYFTNVESWDDPDNLVDYLIQTKQYSELRHFIWFVWTLRKNADNNIRSKTFELWRRLIVLVDASTEEGRELGAKLCDWIVFVNELTDLNRELVYAVVAFADESNFSYELLEAIARISEQQPKEAFELWHRIIQGSAISFPIEAIHSAFRNLIRTGPEGVRNAKHIASQYIRAGNGEPAEVLRRLMDNESLADPS